MRCRTANRYWCGPNCVECQRSGDAPLGDARFGERIGGIGGTADSVAVSTQLRFTRADLIKVLFRGAYLACTDPQSLDMSVLGRDILEMFAVVVDYTGDTVCLLGGQHGYSITKIS